MNIPENFDRWMFDYMEGNLSSSEAEAFEQFLLQNPGFEPDADAWQNSVIPSENVVYPNQQNLQRKRKIADWYGWSAAAMLALLIGTGGYFLMNSDSHNSGSNDQQMSRSYYVKNNTVNTTRNPLFSNSNEEGVTEITSSNYTANNSGSTTNVNSQVAANVVGQNRNQNQNQNQFVANNGAATNANQIGTNSENGTIGMNGIMNGEGEFTTTDSDAYLAVSSSVSQAQKKFHSDEHASQYRHNPVQLDVDLDLTKKSNIKLNSFESKTKRLYRKIEKMFGYPVGLMNLRDPELILPENSLTSFNPGFAGGMLRSRFETNYRAQWFGSEVAAHKAQFNFDTYVHRMKGGIALSLNSTTYNNGAFGDYSIDFAYSPKISLSKNVVFEPGVKVSLGVLTGNTVKFEGAQLFEVDRGLALGTHMNSEIDRVDKLWYKDYGLGFVLNTTWFYAGFSADNLSGHYANVYRAEGDPEPTRTPVLFNGIIGADYESSNTAMTFSPFVSARRFGERTEVWAGMNFRIDHFTLGGAYSTNQDVTISMGMKFKKFKLVYQYDRTRTLLSEQQIGSHNIGIRFTGKPKNARFKH